MRARTAVLLLLVPLLAGCADDGGRKDPVEDADFSGLDLEADETTGVIRGVVFDEAIRPLANVAVSLANTPNGETTTNDQGLFGFSALQPGTYFLTASKAGYAATQQSVEVTAGVSDPPITKVLLTADAETRPYSQTYVFEGFLECSTSLVAVGFAACSNSAFPNDKFSVTYTLDRVPDWLQSEMSWESTQAVSEDLDVVYSAQGESTLLTNWAEDAGPSPLLIQTNRTLNEQWGIGNGTDLFIRVFNEPIQGTQPSDPVNGDECFDRPALGGCLTGLGFTVSQRYTIITTAFFGYTPPPEWLFAVDGDYPPPA